MGAFVVMALAAANGLLSSGYSVGAQFFSPVATVYLPLELKSFPPTPTFTPTPWPTPTYTPPDDVRIVTIMYDPPGDDVEGEYVEIRRHGAWPAELAGWTLSNSAHDVFTFPTFTLAPGATVRVWTKSGTDTSTDLYWGSEAALWDNTGDTAYLRDAGGNLESTYSYGGGERS
jgi:hypothetical protein